MKLILHTFGIIRNMWHCGSKHIKIYPPRKIIFPSGVALEHYDFPLVYPSLSCHKSILCLFSNLKRKCCMKKQGIKTTAKKV